MSPDDRQWSMSINGAPFISDQIGTRQFRVAYNIDVRAGNALALADIALYNLAVDTIIERGSSIVFRAGFTTNIDTIFTGVITNVFKERDAGGSDIRTRLLCRSSAVTARGSASGSYGKGTSVVDVLRDLAQSWPARLDIDETQFDDAPVLTSGYIVEGDIPTALDDLGYMFSFEWTLDNGRLVVNRLNRTRNKTSIQVNQFTGMKGIPEVTRGPNGVGVFVTVRLNPTLRIYDKINVKSGFTTFNTGNLYFSEITENVDANGEYNVFTLTHRGDSHGNLWDTEIDGLRVGAVAAVTSAPEPTATNGVLVWGQKVDQPFRVKTREIASNLNLDPNWLMSVMGFETGNTFDPGKDGPGSATGLIQFIESTAQGLGTSTAALARMSAVEQLTYVEKYFKAYASRIKNIGDCYMAVLWPAAIGVPDTQVLWQQSTGPYQREYAANSGLDVNRNGSITRGEAITRVNTSYRNGAQYAL